MLETQILSAVIFILLLCAMLVQYAEICALFLFCHLGTEGVDIFKRETFDYA